jgi:hypothetical protein
MIAPMIDLRELAPKLVRLEGLRWPVLFRPGDYLLDYL